MERESMKGEIYYLLHGEEMNDAVPDYVEKIEKTLFQFSSDNNLCYRDVCYNELSKIYSRTWDEKMDKYLWKSDVYAEFRNKENIRDEYLTNPQEIDEGVNECTRCGSKKTISFQMQTRSADEGMTNFIKCINCKKKWKE